MRLTIALAAHNVESDTGGPFGAAIFERDSGVLIAPGINMVRSSNCSVAHAEAVAIALAQQVLQTYDLGASHLPALELVTSAQPCIQCFGNVWWSGVKRLVTGASLQQTEALTGFDEGPVPLDWAERLRNRKPHDLAVEVIENVLADEACQVLASYQAKGGIIY
jgi:tRNA(Arg) A34 adenosine deaminase TadA